jgi:predicted ester cyclase
MSIKENKALILRFYDLYNQKKIDECYELVAPEFVLHSTIGDQTREQVKQYDLETIPSFPDGVCILSNLVAEGDKVAFQVSYKGTHKGVYMGIAPTGKTVTMLNTHIVRIKNNKVVEWWGTTEIPQLMQQLGVIPKQ